MAASQMPLDELLGRLGALANQSLGLWDLPKDASARLINVSENATYLIESQSEKAILRIHREDYHSRRAIECELAWAEALRKDGLVATAGHRKGRDGRAVQEGRIEGLTPRYMVLFDFLDGDQPSEDQDLAVPFEALGEIAARTHLHARDWRRPEPFERLRWDLDAVFGPDATWGDWRDAPNLSPDAALVLERVEATIRRRLTAFGEGPDRFGLIHADMRLANLLIGPVGPQLIDFDDCGFGWRLYDFAAGVSFMEGHPQVPALRAAWVRGYRKVVDLTEEDEREIDTFVMFRRMALLAWIGSHIEAPEPQALAPDFARVTAKLGEIYLRDFG